MKQYKFSIILLYYNRPKMVQNSLISIKVMNFNYSNWELLFIDDGSKNEGKPIVEKILSNELNKIKFINTNMNVDDKINNNGSMIGKYINEYLENCNSDYCIMLCDDDAIHPEYLFNLNNYFNLNPNINYIYSHIIKYNPTNEFYYNSFDYIYNKERTELNSFTNDVNPHNLLDASQVCWNRLKMINNGIKFPYPQTINLDQVLYKQMVEVFGKCTFSGFYSQFKGFYNNQLMNRQSNTDDIYKIDDL